MQHVDNKVIVGGGIRLLEFLACPKTTLLKLLFCFFFFTTSLLSAETVVGKCVGVADGDTATVLVNGNQQVKVRFHGIDAPEKKQDFGQRAKQKLSDLIFGKQVKVEILERDRYGRSVSKVYADGIYTNLEMVKSGLAWHYKQYAPHDTDLANAEKAARSSKIGLWSHDNPTPPWQWRKGGKTTQQTSTSESSATSGQYWISSTGKVHNSGCRYYGSSNKGRYTDKPQGVNCKVCGGTGN